MQRILIRRFSDQDTVEIQYLITTDYQSLGMFFTHLSCLHFRKAICDVSGLGLLHKHRCLRRYFIDAGRDGHECHTGIVQHALAGSRARGENQRLRHV